MSYKHKTVPVQVWADIDEGVAGLVAYLNTIPGVRTHASCQGTLDGSGEGGLSYRPQILVSWEDDATFKRLAAEFDFGNLHEMRNSNSAYLHPRDNALFKYYDNTPADEPVPDRLTQGERQMSECINPIIVNPEMRAASMNSETPLDERLRIIAYDTWFPRGEDCSDYRKQRVVLDAAVAIGELLAASNGIPALIGENVVLRAEHDRLVDNSEAMKSIIAILDKLTETATAITRTEQFHNGQKARDLWNEAFKKDNDPRCRFHFGMTALCNIPRSRHELWEFDYMGYQWVHEFTL